MALVALLLQDRIVRGHVVDAVTGAPVHSALVSSGSARATSDAAGAFALSARTADTLLARRVGYRPATLVASDSVLTLAIVPLATRLWPVESRSRARAARLVATRSADELRGDGALSVGEAVSRLPFVSARSSRGGVALSMRGSRPEQVLVTLDGIALNDPATGVAELSDLPLTMLGAVTSLPGADAATHGSGASGGTLALSSGTTSSYTLAAGSHKRLGAGGTLALKLGDAAVRVGAHLDRADNDFRFHNTESVRDTVERRANSDERVSALFLGVTLPALRFVGLAGDAERGLAGPMNVRTLDRARGRTRRGLGQLTLVEGRFVATVGVRGLHSEYRDPIGGASWSSSSSSSRAVSGELMRSVSDVTARAGVAADYSRGSTLRATTRPRAFVALDRALARGSWVTSGALRVDAVRESGVHASPSLAVERAGRITLSARLAQGFRAPTFYDLYLVSPSWVNPARVLRAERVTLDAELGARARRGALAWSVALFQRRTSDPIVWLPGTFAWSPVNLAREYVWGLEGRAMAERSHFALEVWASARDTRLHTGDAVVSTPYVPRFDGGAVARLRRGPGSLALTLTGIGRRPFATVPRPAPARELPAVFLADIAANWRIRMPHAARLPNATAAVTLGARNLADARWQSISRYPTPGRTWSAGITFQP